MEEILKTSKKDLFMVDPRLIFIEQGYNPRTNFDNEKMIELRESIRENGVQVPVTCWKTKGEEKYWIIDGERRYRAVQMLLQEGLVIKMPVQNIEKPTDEKRAFMALIKNEGEKLLPVELAAQYARLKNYGYSVADIAKQIGKTTQHVYQMLELHELPKAAKEEINSGHVSASKVLKESKKLKDPGKITEVIKEAKEKTDKNIFDKPTKKVKFTADSAGDEQLKNPEKKKYSITRAKWSDIIIEFVGIFNYEEAMQDKIIKFFESRIFE